MSTQLVLASGARCGFERVPRTCLPQYFVMSHPDGEPSPSDAAEMVALAISRGRALAREVVGDPEAYLVIHSGYAARRVQGWHVHVLVVDGRWRKAWLYLLLGGKNLLQALGLRAD